MSYTSIFVPVLAGVISHIIAHYYEPKSLSSLLFALAPLIAVSIGSRNTIVTDVFLVLGTLACSVTLYRLSPFHPLAGYPGPRLSHVSRFWWAYIATKEKQHLLLQKLHEKHGDVVRVGPNHLFIRDANAIRTVLGPKNPWSKSERYHIGETYNSPSSLFTLPPLEHAKRRRLWDRAFTPGSLDSYTPFLDSRVSQLISALDTRYRSTQDHDIDLAEWLSFLAIDFMGDFAYGGMFHCLAEGVDRGGIQKIVEDGLGATEIFGAMPWLRPILVTLPTPTSALFDRARSVVQLRKQRGTTVKDLFYYILGEDGRGDIVDSDMDSETLAQEAALAIAAGSDTTSTALANAMFYLITNDCAMDRLRTEVDSAVAQLADSEALLDAAVLGGLPYLHAVLSETLRLQPAIPNGVPRVPPPHQGPIVVAGHVIPDHTAVQIPTYALQRDARYFSPCPETFWPERWLPEGPELAMARNEVFVHDTTAFMPFSFGPTNCAGRALAWREMRSVLAELVRNFRFQLADGMSQAAWHNALRDKFLLARGSLFVRLEKRL